MAHVNIKPRDRSQVYETAGQAINHLFIYSVFHSQWDDARPFGRAIPDIRKINSAIKARDFSAFVAHKRRGYWRVELAQETN